MRLAAGRYKGRAVQGSFQFGQSSKGNDQIALDLMIDGVTVTTFLNFSDAARPYSEERLRALGWAGHGHALDESKLTKEVEVDISYRTWEGKEQMDVQIVTEGGRVKLKSSMDPAQKASFLARLTGTKPGPSVDF